MALQFLHRAAKRGAGPVALLPGTWNPPTKAHVAMARAALAWADEVVLVIPRALPHKEFKDVSFEERAELIRQLSMLESGFSAGITESGLYFEMADEAQAVLGTETEIGLLCGRDAAERIAAWDYGKPGVFEEMIARHPLLVASRSGIWSGAEIHGQRIVPLEMDASFDLISSTEVRRRTQAGEDWRSLVPESIHDPVARLYTCRG